MIEFRGLVNQLTENRLGLYVIDEMFFLDFKSNPELEEKAKTLIGQTVRVFGEIENARPNYLQVLDVSRIEISE